MQRRFLKLTLFAQHYSTVQQCVKHPFPRIIFPRATGSSCAFSTQSGSDDDKSFEDIISGLGDISLSPAQREKVENIKKQIKGGPKSPRSLYRDIPRPDEVKGLGNFMPKVADNAEALVDYALSFMPEKAGKRGSRRKKRMALKFKTIRDYDAVRKQQKIDANLRKQAKAKRIRQEVRQMWDEVRIVNERNRLREEVRNARAAVTDSSSSTKNSTSAK